MCFVGLPIVSFLVCNLFFPKFAGLTIIPAVLLSVVLAQFLPRQICRWCGASLERQVVMPFDFKTRSGGSIEAELRLKVGNHLGRVWVSIAFLVFYSVCLLFAWKTVSVPLQWELPLGLGVANIWLSLRRWLNAQKGSLLGCADADGLLGVGFRKTKRVQVSWSQIARTVRVEDFNLFGGKSGVWLHFENAQGNILARVPMGLLGVEDEDRFLSVVARYLDSPFL